MEGLRLAALEGPGGGVEACLPLAGRLPLPVAAALGELGLTLQRMGLAGKTPRQIRAHIGAPTTEPAGPPTAKSRRQAQDHPHRAEVARSAPATAI
jgi:hypothetical protein